MFVNETTKSLHLVFKSSDDMKSQILGHDNIEKIKAKRSFYRQKASFLSFF